MGIFKKHITVEELAPEFMIQKEMTTVHKSGIPMRELMDQLRHTRLAATEHYLKKHCGIINERIRFNFPDPLKDAI